MADTSTPGRRRIWPVIRRVWMIAGTVAFVGFAGWSLIAFRATATARRALQSDDRVGIAHLDRYWQFRPRETDARARAGLLFFPGGLVDPVAYAPLTRAVAAAGHPAVLVELPRRGAFGGADDPRVLETARAAMRAMPTRPPVTAWVIAGHSRGGVIASRMALETTAGIGGVALIGTSHPRDFSLAHLAIPVVKILGSRDCVAEIEKSDANRQLLPAAARWQVIDGANHSQFGWYGFQPGDCWPEITRERQHELTVAALVQLLGEIAR